MKDQNQYADLIAEFEARRGVTKVATGDRTMTEREIRQAIRGFVPASDPNDLSKERRRMWHSVLGVYVTVNGYGEIVGP
jgi:hypothetical protein